MKISKDLYLSWLRLSWFFRKHSGAKTYGLGWTAEKVGSAFNFELKGIPFRFIPDAARSYCLLPAGIPNEPETHQFLANVLKTVRGGVIFIDIGASIGEFAIPMAHDRRVDKVIAFEPHPATANALRASVELAPIGKVNVLEKAVGAMSGYASFNFSNGAPTGAGLRPKDTNNQSAKIQVCTLDEAIDVTTDASLIVLIDVEGGELEAFRGGMKLVARHHPLIIFEYNATTRRYFNLSEVARLLGPNYHIFRLRSEDGLLDEDLSNTWNVVALPSLGPWNSLRDFPDLFLSS